MSLPELPLTMGMWRQLKQKARELMASDETLTPVRAAERAYAELVSGVRADHPEGNPE